MVFTERKTSQDHHPSGGHVWKDHVRCSINMKPARRIGILSSFDLGLQYGTEKLSVQSSFSAFLSISHRRSLTEFSHVWRKHQSIVPLSASLDPADTVWVSIRLSYDVGRSTLEKSPAAQRCSSRWRVVPIPSSTRLPMTTKSVQQPNEKQRASHSITRIGLHVQRTNRVMLLNRPFTRILAWICSTTALRATTRVFLRVSRFSFSNPSYLPSWTLF